MWSVLYNSKVGHITPIIQMKKTSNLEVVRRGWKGLDGMVMGRGEGKFGTEVLPVHGSGSDCG